MRGEIAQLHKNLYQEIHLMSPGTRYDVAFQVLLMTNTAVKVERRPTWIHASQYKKMPDLRRGDGCLSSSTCYIFSLIHKLVVFVLSCWSSTALDGSITKALEGLTSLSEELAENSSIDNVFTDWLESWFGKWSQQVSGLLISLAVVAAILVTCGCCCIPCI
ncbi:uncharacterized protein ACNLHF_018124 isoform 1-T1 [Anomaloglossus baeobatrachus]